MVDDHEGLRLGLAAALTNAAFDVIATCSDGSAAVDAVTALHPDVVVMDIRMPHMGGLEATRRIVAAAPGTRVVILTGLPPGEEVRAVLAAGATACVFKHQGSAAVLAAIRGARSPVRGDARY